MRRSRLILLACFPIASLGALGGCSMLAESTPPAASTYTTPPAPPAAAAAPAAAHAEGTSGGHDSKFDDLPRVRSIAGGVGFSAGALHQHTFVAEGADADVTVDPSGTWLAFTSTRHSEKAKLYLQKTDGVTVTQLTTDNSDDAQPAFSPDGKRIAFASNRSGRWAIYLMDIDGRNLVQLTGANGARGDDLRPTWSPDGTQLAFSSLSSRSNVWELWVMDVRTGSRKMIGEGLFPAWCPDKSVSRIAFQKARQRGGREYSIWTIDLENGEPRALTEVAWAPDAALVTPTWSPDGTELAYAAVTPVGIGQPVSAAPGVIASGKTDIWVVSADGTNRRRLTDGAETTVAVSPTFSSDGRVFFISDRSGAESVWSLNPQSLPASFPMASGPRARAVKPEAAARGPVQPQPAGEVTGEASVEPTAQVKIHAPESHPAAAPTATVEVRTAAAVAPSPAPAVAHDEPKAPPAHTAEPEAKAPEAHPTETAAHDDPKPAPAKNAEAHPAESHAAEAHAAPEHDDKPHGTKVTSNAE